VAHPYQRPGELLYEISLITHTGVLIFGHQQTRRHIGTLTQCQQAYRSAQTHCLLAGWWSPASLIAYNWVALFSNMGAIRRVRKLSQDPKAIAHLQNVLRKQHQREQQPAPRLPGWYPDPASQFRQRYWDGGAWTAFTHPPKPR
jgi:hypothetical protein